MAKIKDLIDQFVNEKIQVDYLEKIMGDRFGAYTKYVVQDRAIPDIRDGLKPVQRRILYAMHMVGMNYGTPYKKSARIVGEVIGKYHPHGDQSVYDALVRMSQDFKINVPLIDMHGNNGSIDGDSAAAMRYTEARLSPAAMYLLEDIDKKTVPFIPNYDDSEIEPVILPSKFPNLLINGSDGIASGYATNIPPFNMAEVIKLTIERIKNPSLSIEDAMAIVPAPDFPTGGEIVESESELDKVFKTGKGKVILRSKTRIEGNNIIISEIPYGEKKSDLVKSIDLQRERKEVEGIIEVRDESDKDGLRIVIETKSEANTDVILNYLFKKTHLQVNFPVNMVAIVDRLPKLLGVLDVIDQYIIHEKEVITNRSNFEMDKAKKRLHIVEGYHKLSSIINEVVETIKNSKNKANAKENLVNIYGFTELQAEAIVTLQLYRLTNTDIQEFEIEKANLQAELAKLNKILTSELALKNVIIKELEGINEKIESKRRTIISSVSRDLSFKEEELLIHENVHVIITRDGYVKKLSLRSYQASLNSQPGLKEGDFIAFEDECNTMDTIILFTNSGAYINLPVYKIPDAKYKDLGEYVGGMFDLRGDEKVINIYHFRENPSDDMEIVVSTRMSKIKRLSAKEIFEKRFKKGSVISLTDDDSVVSVSFTFKDYNEVVTVTKYGLILKYPKNEVPIVGKKALGVRNAALKPGDEVIKSFLVPNYVKEEIILITSRGGLKRILLKNLQRSKRAQRGTPTLKTVKTNPYLYIDAIVTNPSRYKESIQIDLVSDKEIKKFDGLSLPKDSYENGAPVFADSEKPLGIYHQIVNLDDYLKLTKDMSKEFEKTIEEKKEQHPNSLLDELGDIIEQQTSIFDYIDDIDLKDDEELKKDLF